MKRRIAHLYPVCGGLACLFAIATLTSADPPSADDGRNIFVKRCSGCHALDINKEGPRLGGVFGRRAGTVPDFGYSDALRKSGIVWDERRLMKWLENPQAVVPGSDMEFRVADANERLALVRYLESLAK